jgi:hypothetical protein
MSGVLESAYTHRPQYGMLCETLLSSDINIQQKAVHRMVPFVFHNQKRLSRLSAPVRQGKRPDV